MLSIQGKSSRRLERSLLPYPFNYFSSLFQVRKAFANRKQLNWFQMIFTSLFLLSLTLIPVAVQNAELQTYPLTTFVSDVFDPLTEDVMKDLKESVRIEEHELVYNGHFGVHKNKAGHVIIGHHEGTSLGEKLTLYFDKTQLVISRENKELASIPYQAINQKSLENKDALSQAISKDWFQANRLAVSLFLVLFSGFLSAVNFAILVFGASFFLFLTRKSRLFSLKTFKECFNFTLNCLGLPILASVLISLLFHQVFTTTILIQNILFVLFLALAFYKTHFRDPDYKP